MSRKLSLPEKIKKQGKDAGKRLMFQKAEKMLDGVTDLGRKKLKDCTFSPMITKSLQQLKREHVVKEVARELEDLERSGGSSVHITFIIVDTGVDITVSISRTKAGRTTTQNVKYLKLTEERLRDLRRNDAECLVGLPADKPLVQFMSSPLNAMLHKLTTS
mmetsp:Transcript_63218/g.147257  ORF Transcript_63218/g.147257 Transcript_63218/m.147257 type:complete len:161 (-) Transcript_63218:478-960(-)